jgi:hypothetical protein
MVSLTSIVLFFVVLQRIAVDDFTHNFTDDVRKASGEGQPPVEQKKREGRTTLSPSQRKGREVLEKFVATGRGGADKRRVTFRIEGKLDVQIARLLFS